VNTVIDLQRELGHDVLFVSDSKPTQVINAPVVYMHNESTYTPGMKDGHVWLQVDRNLDEYIKMVLHNTYRSGDILIAHDIFSFLAMIQFSKNTLFIQHETDILTSGYRFSYLSDEWLDLHRGWANFSQVGRIGLTIPKTTLYPKNPVYTPCPFVVDTTPVTPTKGLLYIGDKSKRKGAVEFMRVARALNVRPTVITHELDDELFAGADVYSFSLQQRDEMINLIRQHKVAYIPSKNECPGLAVLECLQYMPTVILGDYGWTSAHRDTGATISSLDRVVGDIDYLLKSNVPYVNAPLRVWANTARTIWIELSKGK